MSKHIVFLGGGPAGYVGALYASNMGAKATVIEEKTLGGTCLNKGCIPTKTLLTAAEILEKIKRAKDFGIEADGLKLDFVKLQQKKERIINQLAGGIEFLFKKRGINWIKGAGSLIEPRKVEVLVDGVSEIISADDVVLATGSVPFLPGIFVPDGKFVLTSDEILELKEIPQSLGIIGGGAIGIEMAYLFSSFGTEVTVVEMMPNILPGLDGDISRTLEREFKKRKIKIFTSSKVEKCEIEDGKVNVSHDGGSFSAQKVLVSVGRRANLKGIDASKLGLSLNNGCVSVDGFMKTNLNNTWAAGDLIGPPWLAHASSYEAEVAVNNILGNKISAKLDIVPACVFTCPEIAYAGLTEEKARQMNINYEISRSKARGISNSSATLQAASFLADNYKVGRFDFRALGKAQAQGEVEGFVKIIFDSKTDQILGIHIIGPSASSLVSEGVLALKHKLKIKDFISHIRAHPTLPEALKEAALSGAGTPIHS